MALSKDELEAELAAGAMPRAVGVQDGRFHLVCEGRGVLSDKDRAVVFPSLNHVADFLQRRGVTRFEVDVSLWRRADTGRARSSARP